MAAALPSVRNLLKAWALLCAVCAVLGLVGWGIDGYRVASIFVFSGLLMGVGAYWYADRVALGMVGARELLPGEAPALHSSLDSLSARAGVLRPKLWLLADGHPRSLAAGRGPAGSAIAVSTGLLAALTPAELEGVLAHELAHIRHRDVLVQTTAVVTAALIVESSRIGGWLQRALLFESPTSTSAGSNA